MTHKQTKNQITRLIRCLKGKRKLTADQETVAPKKYRTKSQSNANLREKEKALNNSEPFVMSSSIVIIFALEKQTTLGNTRSDFYFGLILNLLSFGLMQSPASP